MASVHPRHVNVLDSLDSFGILTHQPSNERGSVGVLLFTDGVDGKEEQHGTSNSAAELEGVFVCVSHRSESDQTLVMLENVSDLCHRFRFFSVFGISNIVGLSGLEDLHFSGTTADKDPRRLFLHVSVIAEVLCNGLVEGRVHTTLAP